MKSTKLVLYVIPDSDLCIQAEVLLRLNDIEFEKVDVTKEPFDQWVYGYPILDTPEGYKVGINEIREYIKNNNSQKDKQVRG